MFKLEVHYYIIFTSLLLFLLRIISVIITSLLRHYYRNNDPIIMYYYCIDGFIVTVIMGSLTRIITRSIIRNNGVIITHYRPEQLGDEEDDFPRGDGRASRHSRVTSPGLLPAVGS